jgi:class 3 adenylate cyclase/tetratricopeptide (TPR) repeat protein
MQQITDWLKKLGMSEYQERFVESDVDISVLPYLTDQDLKDLGVSLGHRRKMLAAIAELPGGAIPRSVQPVVTEPIAQDTAERRQITVMFSDLVGSTALSVRMDPEDLREVISVYQKCAAEIVHRFGGFVAQYLGDGVLVYFGYPQAHEDDAERAVRAALELIAAVGGLQTRASLQTRVGIATGLVVVGNPLGAGDARERGISGETPNLAARLQALAEPGKVVIASTTRRLTGGLFEYRDLGAVALKGFAEKVPAWEVLGASAAESRFEALRASTTPLVGREEELELLLRRWEQTKRGDGCVVLVSGEPGIGKSRIAQALLQQLSGEPLTRMRYFCSPHHQDSALYPIITQLERAAGFRRDDTVEQRLDKLEAVLAQATNDLVNVVPLLADLLSIPIGERYLPLNLSPQKRKERTLHAQLAQVQGLAARQPVLMLFEDVHWSDPTTRESLDLLIDCVPTLRVLAILTFRPEFAPPWIGRSHVTLLSLNRLPPRQRAEMITQVVGCKALPKEIADQIIDRTDGVPLFIEEMTKAVVESGVLVDAGDRYAVKGPIAPLAIPTTLQASLLARLDRLAPTRDVVQIGAVLGRQFSHELISAVALMPQQQLDNALEQLVRAELIFRRGTPPDAEYTFKHALVQDAAYRTLLRGRRQELHARIAATLEDRFPEIVAAQPALVAQHCAEGSLTEKAVDYSLKAGQQAIARSANIEAMKLLQNGLDMLRTIPESQARLRRELDLEVSRGKASLAAKGYSASETGKAYDRAAELCHQLDEADPLVPILYGRWVHQLIRGEYNKSCDIAQELLRLKTKKARSQCIGHRALGVNMVYLGKLEEARSHFKQGLSLYDSNDSDFHESVSPQDARVTMLMYSAIAELWLGFPERAILASQLAQTEAQRVRSAFSLAMVHGLTCAVYWSLEVRPALAEHAAAGMTLSIEHGFPHHIAQCMVWRGWALAGEGQIESGLSLLREGVARYRQTESLSLVALFLAALGEAAGRAGKLQEGHDAVVEALSIVARTEERCIEPELHRLQGGLFRLLCQEQDAEACLHRAITIAREQGAKLWELRAVTSLARLWRDQGKRGEALDVLAPIYNWFTEGLDTPVLKEAKALLEELSDSPFVISARPA